MARFRAQAASRSSACGWLRIALRLVVLQLARVSGEGRAGERGTSGGHRSGVSAARILPPRWALRSAQAVNAGRLWEVKNVPASLLRAHVEIV